MPRRGVADRKHFHAAAEPLVYELEDTALAKGFADGFDPHARSLAEPLSLDGGREVASVAHLPLFLGPFPKGSKGEQGRQSLPPEGKLAPLPDIQPTPDSGHSRSRPNDRYVLRSRPVPRPGCKKSERCNFRGLL
jgi:hypothetical protein